MRIFFAGPLTDLANPEQTKKFYKKMADVAQENGFDYYWAFMRGTDPELNPDVSPSRVFQIDTYELEESDLMIAYVGEPSVGTGEEIEFAREHRIPVYLLFEKDKKISRMLLGTPNLKGTIEFSSEEDALSQLDTLLKSLEKK
jgi:2'-deoxynucleoside 5'-phosphate N-hydrolase